MNLSERLSTNFTLGELIASSTAARLGIENSPTPEQIQKLRWLASNLEMPRALLVPLHVDSGFRCEALERALCEPAYKAWCVKWEKDYGANNYATSWLEYFVSKQHPFCEAADLKSLVGLRSIDMCRRIAASDIPFDQLIHEYDSWMHLSFAYPPSVPRREILTINASGTKIGLVETSKEVAQ